MNSPNEPDSKDAIISTKSTRHRPRGWHAPPKLGEVAPQPPIRERKPKLKPIEGEQLTFLGATK